MRLASEYFYPLIIILQPLANDLHSPFMFPSSLMNLNFALNVEFRMWKPSNFYHHIFTNLPRDTSHITLTSDTLCKNIEGTTSFVWLIDLL